MNTLLIVFLSIAGYLFLAFLSATITTAIKKWNIKTGNHGGYTFLSDDDHFEIALSAIFAPVGLIIGLVTVTYMLAVHYGGTISDTFAGINEKKEKNK